MNKRLLAVILVLGALAVAGAIAYVAMTKEEKPQPTNQPSVNEPVPPPKPEPSPITGECRKTGCSGQICSDEDVVTTCEFRAEYACYRAAACERQANGQCGWTMSAELARCLQNPPQI